MNASHDIAAYGYKLVPWDAFINATDRPEGLLERATAFKAKFVLYDPEDDVDGLLLVGDDPRELLSEARMHIFTTSHSQSSTRRMKRIVADYMRLIGLEDDEAESALTDVLCDLMHWADATEIDFAECLRVARIHHQDEQDEPAES